MAFTAPTTLFRRTIMEAVAGAANLSDAIVERWVDDPVVDGDGVVCSQAGGWRPNEENRFFRVYSFTVRVLLPKDPTVGPMETDYSELLEDLAETVLAALPQSPNVGDQSEWIYYVDEVAFDVDKVSADFSFSVELENPGEF